MVDSRYFCILSPGLCLAKGVVDTARRYTNPPRQRHYYSGNIELVRPTDYPNRIQPVRPNLPWWGWLNPALGLGYELFGTKKGREYVKHGLEEIGRSIEHGIGTVAHKVGGTIEHGVSEIAEKASGPLSKAVTIILVILILLVILKVK